ncbi:SIR2-domain-containing protein [Acaromyces ingoldii]|uniref:SIR2-domain-containing protein n=1 Tax=Acaromyces ingoldii TaxID=215250 RepID=A0A316YMS4_9BASI|nr:SIR2-domain-containing protein [Acaromyces ingoldii]PWN90667.1 SIR2-domain-containing protein [Acaromyces ingoldii]
MDVQHDCDSDELEMLEEEAEEEQIEDSEIDLLVEQAALLYPPERVDEMVTELKQLGLVRFMQNHVVGLSKDRVKALIIALGTLLPSKMRNDDLPLAFYVTVLKTALARILRRREKLPLYNTVDDVIDLITRSNNIVVLGGAGISTSCGIPDFRSKDGIYAQLQKEGKYDLADPQDMFDKEYFLQDPSCFFSFAHSIFPSNFVPSPSHRFIKLLEEKDKLLRNYTQNIDTLEEAAGIKRVLHCHGSFAEAQCTTPGCGRRVLGSAIKDDIFAHNVPTCPDCAAREEAKKLQRAKAKKSKGGSLWDDNDDDDDDNAFPGLGVMKPCITFFGEKLSDDFDHCLLEDREKVDLLIVMGTSLKVAPVSELVGHLPHSTPVILINRTPVVHMAMDIQLLGDADIIVDHLCRRLGWTLPPPKPNTDVLGGQSAAKESEGEGGPAEGAMKPERLADSHIWLFPGAEANELIEAFKTADDEEGDDEEERSDSQGPTTQELPVQTQTQTPSLDPSQTRFEGPAQSVLEVNGGLQSGAKRGRSDEGQATTAPVLENRDIVKKQRREEE